MSEPAQTVSFIGVRHLARAHGRGPLRRRAGSGRARRRAPPDLAAAQQMIDILALLEQKTRGNLTAEERQVLEQMLYELRLRYVEAPAGRATGRASSSRDRPGPGHVSRHGHLARRADDRLHLRACARPTIRATTACGPRSTSSVPDLAVLVDTAHRPAPAGAALPPAARRRDPVHAQPRRSHHGPRRHPPLQRAPGRRIPCYADARTSAEIRRTFAYIFDGRTQQGGGVPRIDVFTRSAGAFCLAAYAVIRCRCCTAQRRFSAIRIGTFAYLTDCSAIPEESWPLLDGVETLVIDALRDKPHPTHFTVAEALAVVERLRPSARVLHAYRARSAARGDVRAAARGRRPGI